MAGTKKPGIATGPFRVRYRLGGLALLILLVGLLTGLLLVTV